MAKHHDLTDQKFGKLTMLEYVGNNNSRQAIWRAVCECGQTTDVLANKAVRGHTTSCGCLAVNVPVDMVGKVCGRLTVLGPTETEYGRHLFWEALCECGNVGQYAGAKLRNSHTKSCGCLQRETAGNLNRTHGMSDTPTYSTWCAMWRRTTNPGSANWENYGGRGIRVCQRWRSFENFLADMGEKPEGLSIEREDNDKGYSPGNCVWADRLTQNRNQRPRKDRRN